MENIIGTSIILLIPKICIRKYINKKRAYDELLNFIYGTSILIIVMNCYNNNYNDDIFLIKNNDNIREIMDLKTSLYISYSILSIYDLDYISIYHHIISLILTTFGKIYLYHNMGCITLLLFSISTPLLCISKSLNDFKYKWLSKITFTIFTILYVSTRIIGFSLLIKRTLIEGYNKIEDRIDYVGINILFILLYKLQIYWLFKIMNVIKRKVIR